MLQMKEDQMREEDLRLQLPFLNLHLLGEYYFVKNRAETSYLFNKGRGKGLIRLVEIS